MNRPSRRVARAVFARPGDLLVDGRGGMWRWDGTAFQPLEVGDVVLDKDGRRWCRWLGAGWSEVRIERGTIVRVTASRGGRELNDELCVVERRFERDGWTFVACRPWPEAVEEIEIPIELVMPVAGRNEFGDGEVPNEHG